MADAKFEEVIRLAFETAGTDGIKQAAGAIAGMGDVSEEARQKAAGLLDDIGNVEKAGAAARQYEQVGKQVLEYQRQISAARSKVLELSAAVKAADEPTKAQQRELAKARSTLSDLVGEQQRELATLRTLKVSLDGQGISTRNAASAQKDLAARTATASANLRDMVTGLKAQRAAADAARAAEVASKAELAAAAARAKREADEYDAALKKVRHQLDENAAAARQSGEETVASLQQSSGAASAFRGVLATIAGFFSVRAAVGWFKDIVSGGNAAEQQLGQLNAVLTSTGNAAGFTADQLVKMAKRLSESSKFSTGEIIEAQTRLLSYTDVVGNSVPKAMQVILDQSARLGISLPQSAEVVGKALQTPTKAMEALGKQGFKLTGEQKALLEQLEATGHMAEAQAVIMDMLTESYGGAAAAQKVGTIAGLWSAARNALNDFLEDVANAGLQDYLKQTIGDLLQKLKEFAADGSMARWAKQTSDAMIALVSVLKRATTFVIEHAGAIKNLALAYGGLRVLKFGGDLLVLSGRMLAFTKGVRAGTIAVQGLGVGLRAARFGILLFSGPVGWVIAALGVFAIAANKAAGAIVEYALKHGEATKQMVEADAKYKSTMQSLSDEWGRRAAALAEYQDVQLKTAEQMAKMTANERAAYKARLDGYIEYTRAIWKQTQLQAAAHHDSSEETIKDIEEQQKAFVRAQAAIKDYNDVMSRVASAAASSMSVSATYIADSIKGIQGSTEELKKKLSGLFVDFGKNTAGQMGDIALALADVSASAGDAGTQIRQGIRENIAALSSEDLLAFQQSSNAAFVSFNTDAKQAAVVVEATLHAALTRLGVTAEQWGEKTTEAGQQNIAAFQVVATNAVASSVAITAAFNKALAGATTVDDAKAIGDAMQKAGEKGKVGFDVAQRAVAAVENRVRSLKTAMDPLASDFAALGIQSQRMLDDTAAKARSAFDNITRGAREGRASMNDVRAAFEAYSRAQMDSVAHAEAWKREQVRGQLEVQASIFGVSDGLASMGAAGLDAGDKVASGARHAGGALDAAASSARNVAAAAEGAGNSAAQYGEKSSKAAKKSENDWISHSRTVATLTGLSQNFLHALEDLNKYSVTTPHQWLKMWNDTVGEWRRQSAQLDEQLVALNKQNGAYDELTQRVEALRQTYNYLNDDQLRALAQAQQTLEQNQKRAEDEAKQKAQDLREKNAAQNAADTERWNKELGIDPNAGAGKPGAGTEPQRIAIDLSVSASQQAGSVPAQLSPTDVQKVANEVVRQIGIARTMSNR